MLIRQARPTTAGRTASRRTCRTSTTTSRPKTSGEPFNCNAPTNDSPHNTGLTRLPAGRAAGRLVLVRPVAAVPGAGRKPTATAASRRWAARRTSPTTATRRVFRFPNYYKGKPLFYEWTRDYIKEFRLSNGRRLAPQIVRRSPDIVRRQPDGHGVRPGRRALRARVRRRLFAENPDAQLTQDQLRARQPHADRRRSRPTARPSGRAPLDGQFTSAGTSDPDGDRISYAWDFDADGKVDSREPRTRRSPTPRTARTDATLKVTDRTGRTRVGRGARARRQHDADGRADDDADAEASRSSSATPSPTRSRSTDDTPVDCSKVTVAYVLGHEQHGHPLSARRAARLDPRRSSTPATPGRRTSAPCSSPPTPTRRRRASRR